MVNLEHEDMHALPSGFEPRRVSSDEEVEGWIASRLSDMQHRATSGVSAEESGEAQ